MVGRFVGPPGAGRFGDGFGRAAQGVLTGQEKQHGGQQPRPAPARYSERARVLSRAVQSVNRQREAQRSSAASASMLEAAGSSRRATGGSPSDECVSVAAASLSSLSTARRAAGGVAGSGCWRSWQRHRPPHRQRPSEQESARPQHPAATFGAGQPWAVSSRQQQGQPAANRPAQQLGRSTERRQHRAPGAARWLPAAARQHDVLRFPEAHAQPAVGIPWTGTSMVARKIKARDVRPVGSRTRAFLCSLLPAGTASRRHGYRQTRSSS